ncbi:MAG: twin-arginine translocation signal domain-containing protein, partial [Pirellulales bacterium]|nr:twin-arginine translocation signal domain-containing protein [Pirellulales bacterium]
MSHQQTPAVSRRAFVKQAAAGSLAALATPALLTASKTDATKPVVGVGEHQYEVDHDWAKLPEKFTWQTTHNVAVGRDGTVYVIHEGRLDQPEHPAIFAFDAEGNFIRSFGPQFQGGGHGLETRTEGSDEFIYVTAYQQKRSFAK